MARRARKGVDYTQIIIIAAIVLAVGGVALFLANRTTDDFAGLKPLPVDEFMANGNSLSGSVFKLSGTIKMKPRFTSNNGAVVLVEVKHGAGVEEFGVYVPEELQGTKINIGDTFTARVEVLSYGRLSFQEIR